MLFSLKVGAAVVVSIGASWLVRGAGDAALNAENGFTVPRNLSTLRLALIGLGTLAAYTLIRWRPLRRPAAASPDQLAAPSLSSVQKVEAAEEQKRGAA